MNEAQITVDADFSISPLDRRLFGSFVEHMAGAFIPAFLNPATQQRTTADFGMT